VVVEMTVDELRGVFEEVLPHLNERQRRLTVGSFARGLGRGGKTKAAEASGMSRNTVIKAVKELEAGVEPSESLRERGGGDRQAIDKQPGLLAALDELVWPEARGHPMSPLRWTNKSTYTLAEQLRLDGWEVSAELVRRLLHQMGYSLQAPSKTKEGDSHPDRDRQFQHINATAEKFQKSRQPVISVDTKKKELVGNYDNGGVEWQVSGEPVEVNGHDFPDPKVGKAIPYGVYDLANNEGWVSVGDVADTAEFAVESIRRWWNTLGKVRFPKATKLMITADAGGSNGYRVRAWKKFVADLASETGLTITVCHYPPGTSKWNKIEHRMFSFISMNWRGRPLTDLRTIVELIAATTTDTGLTIHADLDLNWYPTGVKITDTELAALPIKGNTAFHPEWNYTISPDP
jgi:hypothetical protein